MLRMKKDVHWLSHLKVKVDFICIKAYLIHGLHFLYIM